MFEREHHRRIARVLEALDPEMLGLNHCLFGRGTAMALRYGEYRESIDIDFLVSDGAGYRNLRQGLTGPDGLRSITRDGQTLQVMREVRADQYGIRTMLEVDTEQIKFEIVLEGRIELEAPGRHDQVCGIATLTPLDMLTSKLLANSDRWADDSTFSRDLIDLAMMKPPRALLRRAIDKAAQAYGTSIEADLAKAVTQLLEREGRLERCMKALSMTLTKAQLWQRIKAVARASSR